MAKRPSTKKPKPARRPYAVYLIKEKPTGVKPTAAERRARSARIHQHVLDAGGTCALFTNKKSKPDEWVSIIRGLSPARFRQMVDVIEGFDNVTALMMHMFKGP